MKKNENDFRVWLTNPLFVCFLCVIYLIHGKILFFSLELSLPVPLCLSISLSECLSVLVRACSILFKLPSNQNRLVVFSSLCRDTFVLFCTVSSIIFWGSLFLYSVFALHCFSLLLIS